MLIRTKTATVMMAQSGRDVDHFAGLERSLAARSISSDRVFPNQPAPRLTSETRGVVVSNTEASLSRFMLRQANRIGCGSTLVMDGLLEWRNTFINPATGGRLLHESPVDVIACAGEIDRRVLAALGNVAVATGLPRLCGLSYGVATRQRSGRDARRVMIATAKTPAFTEQERAVLAQSLRELKLAAELTGIEIVWRVTGGLETGVGVTRSTNPLQEAFSTVDAVLTTPSTLMIESMMRGLPTAILHPYRTPLWQPSVWLYNGKAVPGSDPACRDRMSHLDEAARNALDAVACEARERSMIVRSAAELLERVVSASPDDMKRQAGILSDLYSPSQDAAERLALLIATQVRLPAGRTHRAKTFERQMSHDLTSWLGVTNAPDPIRPRQLPPGLLLSEVTRSTQTELLRIGRPLVVIVIACDDAAGNTTTAWATEVADTFSAYSLGYDVVVLRVQSSGDSERRSDVPRHDESQTCVCVLDPYSDNATNLDLVIRTLESLSPSVVLATNSDMGYAAAIQARARAAACGRELRIVGVASDHDRESQDLLRVYGELDAAIGIGTRSIERLLTLREMLSRPIISLGSDTENPAAATSDARKNDQCRQMSELFDVVRRRPFQLKPTSLGVRLVDTGHRLIRWADDPEQVRDWLDARLREAGFRNICDGVPRHGCDCVVLHNSESTTTLELVKQYETAGVAVVYGETLMQPGFDTHDRVIQSENSVRAALRSAAAAGCRRIVLYGAGMHLCRYAGVFDLGFPIVGIMDDAPPKWREMFGVPMVATRCVMETLHPDAIVLFSDMHEARMWKNTLGFRRAGVRVIPIYGTFHDEDDDEAPDIDPIPAVSTVH